MTTVPMHDLSCPDCTFATEHGHWPSAMRGTTHCRACGRYWPVRTEQQHCVSCHRHFKSVRAADMHRKSDQCVEPASLVNAKGQPRLVSRETEHGPLWSRSDDRLPPSRRSAASASGSRPTADRDDAGDATDRLSPLDPAA